LQRNSKGYFGFKANENNLQKIGQCSFFNFAFLVERKEDSIQVIKARVARFFLTQYTKNGEN
jgi:hypothetical protein